MEETKKLPGNLPAFIIEAYKRFGLKSPKFFKIVQYVGLVAAAVGYVPVLLAQFKIIPTGIFNNWLEMFLQVAGTTAWVIANLPVVQVNDGTEVINKGEAVPKTEALPFTAKKEEDKVLIAWTRSDI